MNRFRLWPGIVFALLGINACVVAATLYLAHSDRSFAVEPEYDRKALAWEVTAAQRARSRELNWTVDFDIGATGALGRYLTVRLSDSSGAAVTNAAVSMVAFHGARAGQRLSIQFSEQSPGEYAATAPLERAGIWNFELRARAGADTHVSTLERSVPGVGVTP